MLRSRYHETEVLCRQTPHPKLKFAQGCGDDTALSAVEVKGVKICGIRCACTNGRMLG